MLVLVLPWKRRNQCCHGDYIPSPFLLQSIYTRSRAGIGRDCLTSLDGWLISLWMAIFRFSVFQPFLISTFPCLPQRPRVYTSRRRLHKWHGAHEFAGNQSSVIGCFTLLSLPHLRAAEESKTREEKTKIRGQSKNEDIIAKMCQPNHLIIINELLNGGRWSNVSRRARLKTKKRRGKIVKGNLILREGRRGRKLRFPLT